MTTLERLSVLEWLDITPTNIDDFDCYIRRLDAWIAKRGLAGQGDIVTVVKSKMPRYDPAVYVGEHLRYRAVVDAASIPAAWSAVREFVETKMEATCPT